MSISPKSRVVLPGRARGGRGASGSVRRRAGFTLLEIAISLAIIGFALVAVIGVLPNGLAVQQENREKTIVNEDARFLLEAIREGDQALWTVTEHLDGVVRVGITPKGFLVTNLTVIPNNNGIPQSEVESDLGATPAVVTYPAVTNRALLSMALLSSPRGADSDGSGLPLYRTVALMRSFSGGLLEQATDQAPGQASDLSFRYLLTVEVVPFSGFFAASDINVSGLGPATPAGLQAQNRLNQVNVVGNEAHELRLTFQWPVLGHGRVGPNRQSYRTVISGTSQPVAFLRSGMPAAGYAVFQSQGFYSH
jgi:prepilin-type N-terminal cleavage/methylation domain-containing protein